MPVPSDPHRRPQVAIIGSSEADEAMFALAEQAGAVVGKLGAALVTGGRGGVMAAASRGCNMAGGIVIAVTPGTGMDECNEHAHYVIPTGLGWARNVITGIAGDVVVAVGGASGTLSEIAFAWMYSRPILALSGAGGWARDVAGRTLDHRRDDTVIDCRTIDEFEMHLRAELAKAQAKPTPPECH